MKKVPSDRKQWEEAWRHALRDDGHGRLLRHTRDGHQEISVVEFVQMTEGNFHIRRKACEFAEHACVFLDDAYPSPIVARWFHVSLPEKKADQSIYFSIVDEGDFCLLPPSETITDAGAESSSHVKTQYKHKPPKREGRPLSWRELLLCLENGAYRLRWVHRGKYRKADVRPHAMGDRRTQAIFSVKDDEVPSVTIVFEKAKDIWKKEDGTIHVYASRKDARKPIYEFIPQTDGKRAG